MPDVLRLQEIERKQLLRGGAVASSISCSAVRAGIRQPDWLEMVTPTPPGAITLPTSSSSTAVP